TSPRQLQIVNTKRQSTICELLFSSPILAIKLNRKTLVVVLETKIYYVYDMSSMRLLHVLETVPNPGALAAPAPPAPTASGSGNVMLFSTRALAPVNVLRALSANGSLRATASVKGTVIRVVGVPSADKLYEFRRGAREARIQPIAFNGAGTLLAAASERGTVHLWRVGKPDGDAANKSAGNFSPFSLRVPAVVAHQGGGGVPARYARGDVEPARAFAWMRLPPLAVECLVFPRSTTPHVMIISSDGYFYAYIIDLERGGECVLVRQYSCVFFVCLLFVRDTDSLPDCSSRREHGHVTIVTSSARLILNWCGASIFLHPRH
ncbi:hypothetical protein B0H17DRAFT_949264, partial [Mycena rosella]